MFGLLDDDDEVGGQEVEAKVEKKEEESTSIQVSTVQSDAASTDNAAWTDVASTKSRRLAPQWTSTKQESPAAASTESSKKKVLRFTRDEIMALRRPTRVLPEMLQYAEVVSEECLEPVSLAPIDPDEVIKIWNAASDQIRTHKDSRGRGRGRGKYEEEKLDENIWDDCGPSASQGQPALDLADFSAATLKFSEGSFREGKHDEVDMYDLESDETMAQLVQEQNKMSLGGAGGESSKEKSKLLSQTLGVGMNNNQGSSQQSVGGNTGGIRVMSAQDQMYQLDTAKVQSVDAQGDDDNFLESLIEEDRGFTGNSSQVAIESLKNDASMDVQQAQPSSLFDANSFMGSVPLPPAPLPPAPEVVMVDAWYYKDPQQNLQGPFDTNSMRRWYESGYFKGFLPIKMKHWASFHLLGDTFPSPDVAFLKPIPEPFIQTNDLQQQRQQQQQQQEQQQQQQRQQQLQLQQEQEQRQRQIHQQQEQEKMQKRLQQQRYEQEQHQLQQQQLQQQQRLQDEAKKREEAQQREEVRQRERAAAEASQEQSERAKKQDKDKKDKAPAAKKEKKEKPTEPAGKSQPQPPQAPAWGQPAASTAVQKSMAEIQQEEERREKEEGGGSSRLLKSLLGVSGGGAGGGAASGGKVWGAAAKATPSSSSLRDIQQEQVTTSQQQAAAQQVKLQNEAKMRAQHGSGEVDLSFSSSQWKSPEPTTGTSKPAGKSKSLVDIMQEEATLLTSSGEGGAPPKTSANSWASRTSNPNAPVQSAQKRNVIIPQQTKASVQQQQQQQQHAKPQTAPVSSAPLPNNQREIMAGLAKNKEPKPMPSTKKEKVTKTATPVASAPKKTGDSLTDWGVDQLKNLNTKNKGSTDDLALIQFCLILESSIEIREYLAEYLGSTPEVSLFATEFIRRKEGKPASSSYTSSMSSSSASAGSDRNNTATFGVAGKKKNKDKKGKAAAK